MKCAIFTCLLLFGASSTAMSQQPSSRRGLDQIDLLSVPRATAQNETAVNVDLETFQLLEPLVRYCRELERDYKSIVIDQDAPLTADKMTSVFMRKADAISRSLFLIRAMEKPSPQLTALLDETDRVGRDLGKVILALHNGETADVVKELSALNAKYDVAGNADRKQLVAAILRRLNGNLARLRVAQ